MIGKVILFSFNKYAIRGMQQMPQHERYTQKYTQSTGTVIKLNRMLTHENRTCIGKAATVKPTDKIMSGIRSNITGR